MMRELDIHGYTESEAIKIIERELASLPNDVKSIRIIHGYHSGDSLKKMVQNPRKIRSKKIKRRKYTMNQGETILELY